MCSIYEIQYLLRTNPGYSDPDVEMAGHLIHAAWHLQKIGRSDMSEQMAAEAAAIFDAVPYDKKTRKKKLGNISYLPSGIFKCPAAEGIGPRIELAAPPYETPDDPDRSVDEKKWRSAASRTLRGSLLGEVSKLQVKAALTGKRPRLSQPGLAKKLSALNRICSRCVDADEAMLLEAVEKTLNAMFSATPFTDCLQYGKNMARACWLGKDDAAELAGRLDALEGDENIIWNVINEYRPKQKYATWAAVSGYDLCDVAQDIAEEAWRESLDGTEPVAEQGWWRSNVTNALCMALRAAKATANDVRANEVLSGIPEDGVPELLAATGMILKDFRPDPDLYKNIAMNLMGPSSIPAVDPSYPLAAATARAFVLARKKLSAWFDGPEAKEWFAPASVTYSTD